MFVADLHNDLVQRMMIGEDVTQNTSSGHTDIERLKLSSIDLEVMIVWASEKEDNISYFDFASQMYDKLDALNNIEGVTVPRTLHAILTEEQIASLPPLPPPRAAYVPGQPSTSGREFLPETRILELTRQHPNTVFSIQFEKRNGTLRNMTARIGVWKDASGNEKDTQRVSEERSYDPAEYNLKMVFDVEKAAYRTVATDRVTRISLGGQTFQTESAQ